MARIKLTQPQTFPFSTKIPVRITDINYGDHVGNDTILSYIHEARIQYLKSLGYTELNIEGAGLIMSDVTIEFTAEIFYGDVLTAYVAVAEPGRASFQLYYKLTKGGEEKTVAIAKTGMVCFDYDKKKVVSMPEAFKKTCGL